MASEGATRSRLPILLGIGTLGLGLAAGGYLYFGRGASPESAKRDVRRLAEAAVAYARGRTGGPQFPVSSVDWTPRGVACHQSGKRFAPDPGAWAQPPWTDLGFTIDGPTAFQYRVQRIGADARERLVIEARGDRNCNGVYSRYAISVDPQLAIGALEIEREQE
jgi:hypothetical protein